MHGSETSRHVQAHPDVDVDTDTHRAQSYVHKLSQTEDLDLLYLFFLGGEMDRNQQLC